MADAQKIMPMVTPDVAWNMVTCWQELLQPLFRKGWPSKKGSTIKLAFLEQKRSTRSGWVTGSPRCPRRLIVPTIAFLQLFVLSLGLLYASAGNGGRAAGLRNRRLVSLSYQHLTRLDNKEDRPRPVSAKEEHLLFQAPWGTLVGVSSAGHTVSCSGLGLSIRGYLGYRPDLCNQKFNGMDMEAG